MQNKSKQETVNNIWFTIAQKIFGSYWSDFNSHWSGKNVQMFDRQLFYIQVLVI